jgi:hypothetical protein
LSLAFVGDPSPSTFIAGEGAGISKNSSPEKLSFLKKNGHRLTSMFMDSLASAVEMGTGDDLITAVMTSLVGRARRFLEGVDDPDAAGMENSLQNPLAFRRKT